MHAYHDQLQDLDPDSSICVVCTIEHLQSHIRMHALVR